MSDVPQVLLAHHLEALKLPGFLREHEKLARQCAAEGADHLRYLLRLAELELIERERRTVELYRPRFARHRAAAHAARAAVESWSCRTALGGRNPCRSISQVAL